jgi:glycosyltransferase involved in cell wall biosynthesis
MPPKISIIIANYNYERFIARAIESVLQQTYPDVECIVVDDGSTDGSVACARRYPSVIIVEKENGGQVSAILEGMQNATGDIIMFLDSDDYLDACACSRVVESFAPDVSLVQFRLDKVAADGTKIGRLPVVPLIASGHQDYVLKHGFIPTSPTSGNAFAATHIRKMLGTIDVKNESRNFIDGYVIFSAPFTGRVVALDESLGVYLVHGGNVSMAGGRHYRAVVNSVRTSLWQRKGYLRLLAQQGKANEAQIHRQALNSLAPFHYRNTLILRRGYSEEPDMLLAELSILQIALLAWQGFLKTPHMQAGARLLNMLGVGIVLIAPGSFSRRLIPKRK